jgi:hypothetical protein
MASFKRWVGLFAILGMAFMNNSKLLFQPRELSFRIHMTNLVSMCLSKLAHNTRHLGQLLHSRVQKHKDFGGIKIPLQNRCGRAWQHLKRAEKQEHRVECAPEKNLLKVLVVVIHTTFPIPTQFSRSVDQFLVSCKCWKF